MSVKKRARQSPTSGESADRLVAEYEVLLVKAYKAGYSVVYLQRYLAASSPYYIFNVLFARGEIQKNRVNKTVYKVLPLRLVRAFLKMGYNFVNWCDGWKIDDFREAARLLAEPKDFQNIDSIKVHAALKNDYPDLYEYVYNPDDEDSSKGRTSTKTKNTAFANCTITLAYDKTKQYFVGSIAEIPDCVVTASTCDKAYQQLKIRYAIIQQVLKLKLLPIHSV